MTTTADARRGAAPSPAGAAQPGDLRDALGWLVFGFAVLVALDPHGPARGAEHQSLHDARACCPGCSAWSCSCLGVLLGVRSWRRGATPRRRPAAAVDWRRHGAPAGPGDRPDRRLHDRPARPRPAVLARRGALRRRLDRAAAGAAAGARRRPRRELARHRVRGGGRHRPPAWIITCVFQERSWCACPSRSVAPCSADSPTSATPCSGS